MARLPDLISAVAEWDDRDGATIERFVDVLRETGYLPDAQAELPSPELRASEAATLLIALNGSDTPESAADALETFGNLAWNPASEWDDDDPVARTLVGKPFREALAALLHHLSPVVAGSFASGDEFPGIQERSSWVSVSLERPVHTAFIKLEHRTSVRAATFYGIWGDASQGSRSQNKYLARSQTTIFWPTLLSLSRAIAPEQWANDPISS